MTLFFLDYLLDMSENKYEANNPIILVSLNVHQVKTVVRNWNLLTAENVWETAAKYRKSRTSEESSVGKMKY